MAKLALAFHLACAAVSLGALVVVWQVGRRLGTIDRVARFLEDVGFARDFEIRGPVLLRGAVAVAGVLVLLNTIATVVLAFIYNSMSGLLGGLVFSVLEEQPRRRPPPGAPARQAPVPSRQQAARRDPARVGSAAGPAAVSPTLPPQSVVVPETVAGAEVESTDDDWLRAAREVT